VSVRVLKKAAINCSCGGCNILLEAITKVAGPNAMKDDSRRVRSDSNCYSEFEFRQPFSDSVRETPIELFVTEGK